MLHRTDLSTPHRIRARCRPVFVAYTRLVYARLAREVAADVADYRDCGVDVVGLVGIAGSPSCGVETTLDLPAAVDVLSRCPLARLDRRVVKDEAVGAHTVPGCGLFVTALQRQFAERGLDIRLFEYDLAASSGPGSAPRGHSRREAR